jgi:DNA-binding transcriptional MerR regulator
LKEFAFVPPNRGALWSSLALTKTQLAELCGLTTRQISHWTSQGYITAAGREPERYNGNAIDICVLIKQALANGVPLRRAVALARGYITDELIRQPAAQLIVPPTLLDMREKLRGAEASIAAVLEVVEPLVPREPLAARDAGAYEFAGQAGGGD